MHFLENTRIVSKISLMFVPKDSIDNIPTLVQIMAWRRPGDKPLSEPMMVSLLTHICVTWPQRVKICAEYQRHGAQGQGGFARNLSGPGVADKPVNLNLFYSMNTYVSIFDSSVGWVGNLSGLALPSAIVHCHHDEVAHQTIKSPSMPCMG